MPDTADVMLHVYNHALQLTLLDHSVEDAMRIAWSLAAVAWDMEAHEAGMAEARQGRSVATPSPAP